MGAFWGLHVAEMQRLGRQLAETATEVRSISQELDGLTASVQWRGPDADAFRQKTWPAAREELTRLAATLAADAEDINAQVAQQNAASAAGR